ncbi:hypothetical protein EDD21DRAFT_355535 [Dissophora ornata]|nr:hypothetical protein EDD21DRAFT_355535 [Dissophora ornata]
MLAQSDAKNVNAKKEDNAFKHAWHSVEDALHLRSEPPVEAVSPPVETVSPPEEDVPPPVPPKDEKWLVKTVKKSIPEGQKPDRSFWDKLLHKDHSSGEPQGEEEEEAVSISVPADAALKHLGVQGDDGNLQEKKNYFKKMAARVKEKFDEDEEDLDSDSEEDKDHPKTEQEKLEQRQRKKLAPKVDPKEMKEAHRAIYGHGDVDEKEDEEADKKLFGSWWGCHPRRSRAERKLAKEQEAEREHQLALAELAARRKAEQEAADEAAKAADEAAKAAEAAAKAAKRKWWQLKAPETAEQKVKEKEKKERKSTTHKHQAIAAAGKFTATCSFYVLVCCVDSHDCPVVADTPNILVLE